MPDRARALVVVGAGGHAKVVVELFRQGRRRFDLIGFTDLDPSPRRVADLPVLGDDEQLARLRDEGVRFAFAALGQNELRAQAGARLAALGYDLPNAVSRQAAVSPSADLGRGVAIMAGAVINAEAVVGDLAIINSGAVVEHDCQVGEAAHLGPNSVVAGGVTIGARSFLGAGASVIPGIRIGADVRVGAGACVICDLADGVLAVGVPARVIRPATGR